MHLNDQQRSLYNYRLIPKIKKYPSSYSKGHLNIHIDLESGKNWFRAPFINNIKVIAWKAANKTQTKNSPKKKTNCNERNDK